MNKRIWSSVVAVVILFAMAMPAMSAPLFPDVPENHWARDAVATLAAKGLVEGYPDGTFKGDRAATRWEVAMIVARLLAKMEQEHATFATKAELEELRKLVNALREELDALGVRVTNLEESVSRLDQRVTELERITFYGYVDTRGVAQNFRNTGQSDNQNGIGGAGSTNYNAAVGSFAGAAMNPFYLAGAGFAPLTGSGAFPVVDLRNGRPLTNGTGFSMRGVLGLRIRVSDDIDAGAEFSAFTSQGDALVDAYWGVSAPFLSNPFTADVDAGGIAGVQPLNNIPFTRMTLDNFWVMHNPSGTKLTLGSYGTDYLDDVIFSGQYNPNAFGPDYLDRFGFNVNGYYNIEDTGVLRWEVLGSRMGDGTFSPFGAGYVTNVLGMDVGFEFEGGQVKANFMRATNESSGGNALLTGLISVANVQYGASTGWTPLQWVNPPGFYAAQSSAFNQANGGAGTTVDNRPIPGWNTAADNAIGLAVGVGGNFGPQGMTSYGLSADYKWNLFGGDTQIYVAGEYGHSEYKPNKNSGFTRNGDAGRIEVGANLLEGDLDLAVAYLTVDPTYDPFINEYPVVGGVFPGVWRLPDLNYFANLYSLHDTNVYPHNREGITFNGQWRFMERRGLVWAKADILNQKNTSLYDTRVLPGASGAGSPNFPVLGFAPGWIDPVFFGFAHPNIYGAGTASSFTDTLTPLENPRGRQTGWGLGVTYKFDNPRIKVDLGYERSDFTRATGLPANFGGSQNHVDLGIDSGHFALGWEASDQWTLRGGVDLANIAGHWDPAGIYNTFAVANANTGFRNIDTTQTIPFIGFDYDVTANTQWNMDIRFYDTNDNVPASTFAGPTVTAGAPAVGFTSHPFNWQGFQVTTQFKVKF